MNANWSGATANSGMANPAPVTLGLSPISGCTPGLAACIGTSNVGYRYILSN